MEDDRLFSSAMLKYLSGLIIVSTAIIAAIFIGWPHTDETKIFLGLIETKIYARTLGFLVASVGAAAVVAFLVQMFSGWLDESVVLKLLFGIVTIFFPLGLGLAAAWPFIKHAWTILTPLMTF